MDRKLSYDPLIIFRHGSKPKWLQTWKICLAISNITLQKASDCMKPVFVLENVSSKLDLIWHLRPIRKVENARTLILFLSYLLRKLHFYDQEQTFTSCFDPNPSFSWKQTFSFGAIWDLFLEEHTAFCDGFDIILKYDPKTTF